MCVYEYEISIAVDVFYSLLSGVDLVKLDEQLEVTLCAC